MQTCIHGRTPHPYTQNYLLEYKKTPHKTSHPFTLFNFQENTYTEHIKFAYNYKTKPHFFNDSFIHQYSALEARLAGTRAQSCDRYGSGTLHSGQVLGGSLPLLSPAFRCSHFRCQVPVRPQRRRQRSY